MTPAEKEQRTIFECDLFNLVWTSHSQFVMQIGGKEISFELEDSPARHCLLMMANAYRDERAKNMATIEVYESGSQGLISQGKLYSSDWIDADSFKPLEDKPIEPQQHHTKYGGARWGYREGGVLGQYIFPEDKEAADNGDGTADNAD